jgi:hypothetical protein
MISIGGDAREANDDSAPSVGSSRYQQSGGQHERLAVGPPTQSISLDAYIVPGRGKNGKRAKSDIVPGTRGANMEFPASEGPSGGYQTETGRFGGSSSSQRSEIVCPVCSAFTGDQAAVEHHVATHFDS